MTVVETLKAARALIAAPEHWVRNSWAMTADNRACQPTNPIAVKFCALGALRHVDGEHERNAEWFLEDASHTLRPGATVIFINDHPDFGHDQVLRIYDLAIKAAEMDVRP